MHSAKTSDSIFLKSNTIIVLRLKCSCITEYTHSFSLQQQDTELCQRSPEETPALWLIALWGEGEGGDADVSLVMTDLGEGLVKRSKVLSQATSGYIQNAM